LIFSLYLYFSLYPDTDRSVYHADPLADDSVTLITMGDQGAGDYRQRRVAALLETACRSEHPAAILLLGDNFYFRGVKSTTDSKWVDLFEGVYDTPCLVQQPFYALLGNHDYMGNVPAQVEYSQQKLGSGRWQMPDTDYVIRFGSYPGKIQTGTEGRHNNTAADVTVGALVTVVIIDTNRLPDERQLALIRSTFADADGARWRVVMGHENVRTWSEKYKDDAHIREALLPTLQAMHVDLYVSGHSHNLQYLRYPGEPAYVISGAGGKRPRPIAEDRPPTLLYAEQQLGIASLHFTATQTTVTFTAANSGYLSQFHSSAQQFVIANKN